MDTVHATCVAFDGRGVLLRGPPGSGKSDLAARAIESGARLVADDRVTLVRRSGTIIASAPPSIRGMIELRGLGILRIDSVEETPVALVADLAAPHEIERLPEPALCDILGIELPFIRLAPFEASALAKLRLALTNAGTPDRWVR
ncbi:MAG TPA: HPr kinase/phosphatase C-terminal domain-containing protein [Alphaproteobacteria bacterium]|nr:HPr kinase/phosphatase C-terminal domain-containing protein [Alphaproteobacteria bacterium]